MKAADDEIDPASDGELVAMARSGNMGAFDRLITRHRTRVYSMILAMLRNEADAWDVSQEAFIRAWKNLPRFRSDSTFSTWLYRISTNCALDWMRKVRARPTISTERQSDSGEEQPPFEGIDENTPAQDAERAELKTKIDEALERLSPDHRAVILLKEVEGLKYNEIAEAIGCSIGTVMSRLFHARRNLQKYLGDEKD